MDPEKIRERERENSSQIKAYLLLALIIIGVVALGLLALNQFLEFRYKSLWLQTPCDLCAELNPSLEYCIRNGVLIPPDFSKVLIPEGVIKNVTIKKDNVVIPNTSNDKILIPYGVIKKVTIKD